MAGDRLFCVGISWLPVSSLWRGKNGYLGGTVRVLSPSCSPRHPLIQSHLDLTPAKLDPNSCVPLFSSGPHIPLSSEIAGTGPVGRVTVLIFGHITPDSMRPIHRGVSTYAARTHA